MGGLLAFCIVQSGYFLNNPLDIKGKYLSNREAYLSWTNQNAVVSSRSFGVYLMVQSIFRRALLPLATAVLVACGGGGGGGTSSFFVSGTAATGAAITGGTIKVYDAAGQVVATGTTDNRGQYMLSVPVSASAPFVIEVELAGQKLYSVLNEKTDTRANVNQLTHALTAMLSRSGVPELLTTELSNGSVSISSQGISRNKELISTAIDPLKTAVAELGQSVPDFYTGNFSANGTGLDKLLDTANILTTAVSESGNSSTVNVQIAFNVATDFDNTRELPAIKFNSGETVNQVARRASAVQIDSASLPPNEIGQMYSEFLDRIRACYALPRSQRVSGYTVIAQQCKDIFIERDPDRYLDGGYRLGVNRFAGMFTLEQAPVFTNALSPVLIHNITGSGDNLAGKAMVAFRGEDSDGNYLNSKVVVQVYTLNGRRVFGAVGDQNSAEFYVNAESVATNFPLKTTESYDYLSSGYAVWLPSTVAGRGTVKKAVLTTPTLATITMGKWGTRNQLFVCKPGQNPDIGDVCNGLPTFVQGFRYADEQRHNNGESPVSLSQVRSTLVYSRTEDQNNTNCSAFKTAYNNPQMPCPKTDDEIENQVPGGRWTAVYTFTDNTTLTLNTRHPVRALSGRELASSSGPNSKAARLKSETITALKALSQIAVNDGRAYSDWTTVVERPLWAPASGGFQFAWTVAAGQEAPRKVKAIGRVAYDTTQNRSWNRNFNDMDMRPNWEDELNFKTNTRNVEIRCALATGTGDVSCKNATTGSNFNTNVTPVESDVDVSNVVPGYANGVWMSTSLLWTVDNTQTNLMRVYSWYDPSL